MREKAGKPAHTNIWHKVARRRDEQAEAFTRVLRARVRHFPFFFFRFFPSLTIAPSLSLGEGLLSIRPLPDIRKLSKKTIVIVSTL